jgi:RNA polymerase sigma-70 factor (TIGR02960 family)
VGPEDRQFPEFFTSQYGRLRRLGFLLTGDWAQAEDLAQEALVRVYWRWSLVRRQAHPEAYARKVLVNRHRSLLRRLRLEARHARQTRVEAAGLGRRDELLAVQAAIRRLPARQRAVLILREVLRWQATEVAELLDTSVASVNSALQRARATLDELDLDSAGPAEVDDGEKQEFLARYVDAFERYDIGELVTLLQKDVTFNMPPMRLWLQGPDQVAKWMLGPGAGCANARLRVTSANGCPAVGIYKTTDGKVWEPFNIAVLEVANGGIAGITHFIYPELFPAFGLPTRIEE